MLILILILIPILILILIPMSTLILIPPPGPAFGIAQGGRRPLHHLGTGGAGPRRDGASAPHDW